MERLTRPYFSLWSRRVMGVAMSVIVPAAVFAADSTQVPPLVTLWAMRGLTQVASAEPLGTGRLTFCLSGSWYRQQTGYPNAPNSGANIGAGTLAFSFAASEYIELFGTISGYGCTQYNFDKSSGIGSITAGFQGSLPLPKQAPFFLGAQVVIVGGTSQNQLNNNYADGYDYFETRDGYDIMGRAIESFVLGSDYLGFKVMLNEAFSTSVQRTQSNLMMLSAGLQGILARYYVIGLELNSRTYLDDVEIPTDPLWLTPSLTFRSPFYASLTLGCDVSLSGERSSDPRGATQALEPYRLFGGVTFSVDVLARKRREAAEKQQREQAEKAELARKASDLKSQTDSLTLLAQKARQDSIAQARQADSLAQVARQLEEKAKADSIALADSKRKLEEERSKRSDMEKQLLSTGMLVMDAVYFESGKTEISINSKPYLKLIAKMLAKYPKLNLEVGGHTDNRGSPEMNQRLSQARAESVRMFLINVEPNLASRLTATGYGPAVPKADNYTAEGRKINRRTELVVTNKDALKEYNP